MFITLGLAAFVQPVNVALMNMNPVIGTYPNQRNIPYTTESIVSACVKVAASCNFAEDLDQFLRDIAHHLSPFCTGSTQEITSVSTQLIQHLRNKFKEYQWYDSDGSCPWRFVGFVDYFDIQLGKPDHASNTNNIGHNS